MALIVIDTMTSIVQAIATVYTISYCVNKKENINLIKLVKLFTMAILFFAANGILTSIIEDNWITTVFGSHILGVIITAIFYRKKIHDSLVAYSIIYFILGINSAVFGCLIAEYAAITLPLIDDNFQKLFFVYFPGWIILLVYLKYMDKIKQIYELIISENYSVVFFIMTFFLDFIITFYLVNLSGKSQLAKIVLYIMFFLFFAAILVYFWRVHQKSEQILKLNEALETKNNELRKIKHDYGAQISYLYGLCLMKRFEDLKKSLKDIINRNESTATAVEISADNKSVLSLALKPAIERGVHVIIEESCDFSKISMAQTEFYRVIHNIVNNAIKAMGGKGIIIVKSYEYSQNIVIKIENNGPKIPEEDLENIFKAGFTTKENSDNNHGYGLSITKELVESCSGKIYVKSNDIITVFKILLPILQNT